MKYLPIAGLLVGLVLGLLVPGHVPDGYTQYLAVALLAALDTAFGGLRSNLNDSFEIRVFLTGFFLNALFAALITYAGRLLGIDLYIAAVVVFGSRIFNNLSEIRRILLNSRGKKNNIIDRHAGGAAGG